MFVDLKLAAIVLVACAAGVLGQGAGTLKQETHPKLTWQKDGQTVNGEVVVDANWRWTHSSKDYHNCYTGNKWNSEFCPDDVTCAKNCVLDGADYQGTYGVTSSGSDLRLNFVTNGGQKNVGSRLYLMASETKYEMFKLLGKEFTFDVDVSKLACGINGALYFVSMDEDGGMSKYPTNTAGAKFGTGYCDSQCPRDIKFIAGQANPEGWEGTTENSGNGKHGACCAEMDIWEANSISAAYTPHPCTNNDYHMCEGETCGGGTVKPENRYAGGCDPDGCDFNSYRQGDTSFYGPGKTVDTNSKFTVVTQFIESGGALSEIKRFYVQNGKVIPNSESKVAGNPGNSITQDFCTKQKAAFKDKDSFTQHGGLKKMGEAVAKGMVLVMSLWDDTAVDMLWLDSSFPKDKSSSEPGVARGSCGQDTGVPAETENKYANAYVVYGNIKVGPINSTFHA